MARIPSDEPINGTNVLGVLSQHIGATNGINAGDLVEEITGRPSTAADERTLRHVIEALREQGQHVCALPSRGYFIAATADELDVACDFLYERAMTSLRQIAAMKRVSLPDLRGQLHLPT